MRSLLIVFTLLISSFAYAENTDLVLTGLVLEAGQVVSVEVDAKNRHVHMFRVETNITENDELIVVLEDIENGEHPMRITVRDSALGTIVKRQVLKINVE